jgi:hypothetical protein
VTGRILGYDVEVKITSTRLEMFKYINKSYRNEWIYIEIYIVEGK